MKKIYNIIMIAIGITWFMSGCDSWLSVQPADRITEKQVFNSESGFNGALNGVYTEMLKTNLYGAALGCELVDILGQRYNVTAIKADYREIADYKYTNDYPKSLLQSTWEAAYQLILNCNLILENAETHRAVLNDKAYFVIKGEVLALRAFMHFDLLRLFGPIYAKHKEDMSIPYNEKVSVSASELSPARVVLEDRILRDLNQAEVLLQKYDPIVTDGPMMSSEDDNTYRFRGLRMNYYAVLALKARVYLYADQKPEALKYAKMVIEDPKRENYFPFVEHNAVAGNDQNPDRIFSSEVLFSLLNDKRSSLFTSYFDPENATIYKLVPRVNTIETLFQGEESDYRYKPLWANSPVSGDKTLINVRFKKLANADLLYNKLMPLIRLSEMYLIATECEKDEIQAYAYLNVLRNNRGLTAVSDKLDTRLKNEYVKEFVCEGQLFFYYKRTMQPSLISGVTGSKITMTEASYVPPLPESENKYRN